MSSSGFANRHLVNRKPDKVTMPCKEALDNEEKKFVEDEEAWLREEHDWEQ